MQLATLASTHHLLQFGQTCQPGQLPHGGKLGPTYTPTPSTSHNESMTASQACLIRVHRLTPLLPCTRHATAQHSDLDPMQILH